MKKAVPGARIAIVMGSLAAALVAAPVRAQDYPSRPVRMILTNAAGGLADLSSRLVGKQLETRWKQPVVVENRPGGNNAIGHMAALANPADGHTLAFVSQNLALNPFVQIQSFAWTDFQVVTRNLGIYYVLIAHPSVEAKNLNEFIALAKSKKEGLTYAYTGHFTRLRGLQFADLMGTRFVEVPFSGGTDMQKAVLGGHVNFYFGTTFDVGAFSGGKGRFIAVSSPKRLSQHPDLPAIAEVLPGFDIVSWTGYGVKTGTPGPVIEKLNRDFIDIMRMPEIMDWHTQRGLAVMTESIPEINTYMKNEYEQYAKFAKIAGLKPE